MRKMDPGRDAAMSVRDGSGVRGAAIPGWARWGRTAPVLACCVAALLAACNGSARSASESDVAGLTCLEGRLLPAQSPADPWMILQQDDGTDTRVSRPVDDAVFPALSGTRVEVCGTPGAGEPGFRVEAWRLVSVDGFTAVLGTLERSGEDWRLDPLTDGEDDVPLMAVPVGLQEAAGDLVWVSIRPEGERFRVVSYGVLPG